MSEPLSLQIEESVALMTFDRPARLNALNNALIDGIMHTLDRVEFDPGVRVVVITGTGRAFSAGADIAEFRRHVKAGPEQAIAHFMRPGHRMTRRVESFPKPVVAAVNGLAFGGGCELVESGSHRARRRHGDVLQGGNQYRHHPDIRRHPASASKRWPQGRD